MGIVRTQSLQNMLVTYIGFAIGAINTLWMYPYFLGDLYYGLTGYVLSTANILMPFMAFGVHNTVIKYYHQYADSRQQVQLLYRTLQLPLWFSIALLVLYFLFEQPIHHLLTTQNAIIADHLWMIPVVGFCMGYFEIFYAWAKIKLQSVFGSLVKEVGIRILISLALFAVYLEWLSLESFLYVVVAIYALATIAMAGVALRLHPYQRAAEIRMPWKTWLVYSGFIILSGGIANILLDIDKNMIGNALPLEQVAYYSVAIFMATVIAVPSRAMHQIAAPLTARLMSENRRDELQIFYQKASINLQWVGGWIFGGILINLHQIYALLPEAYSSAYTVVVIIGASKYLELLLGNNNAIIFNSDYYRWILALGVLLTFLIVGLNYWMIPIWGITGAAMATFISLALYSLAKLQFVMFKLQLFPFTRKTLYSLLLSTVVIWAFWSWEFSWHPIVNILLKSALFTAVYMGLHIVARISTDINEWLSQLRSRLTR